MQFCSFHLQTIQKISVIDGFNSTALPGPVHNVESLNSPAEHIFTMKPQQCLVVMEECNGRAGPATQ